MNQIRKSDNEESYHSNMIDRASMRIYGLIGSKCRVLLKDPLGFNHQDSESSIEDQANGFDRIKESLSW